MFKRKPHAKTRIIGFIIIIGLIMFMGLAVWGNDESQENQRPGCTKSKKQESNKTTKQQNNNFSPDSSVGNEKQSQKNNQQPLPWIENALTQPLPSYASKTRLSLPAQREDLMPNNAPITGFGAHIGQHVEGLDHVWIAVKQGEPARAWADGKVTGIEKIHSDQGKDEYMVYLDYGDGLACSFAEISKPLVEVGQKVKHLDPIGEISQFQNFQASEIETYCADANRFDGIKPTAGGIQSGSAVSPFDYLNDDDRAWLEKAYAEKVLNNPLTDRSIRGAWHGSDPFLTNKVMVHEPAKITGEWFLINKKWNNNDYSLITFLDQNKYSSEKIARLRIEDANLSARDYLDAPYEVNYEANLAKIVITGQNFKTKYYALAEITENAGTDSADTSRAQMKFEISNSPISQFSSKALTYQERGIYNPRYDAWKMGSWSNYGRGESRNTEHETQNTEHGTRNTKTQKENKNFIQPVPDHASSVRLQFPVPIENILLGGNYHFQGFGMHVGDRSEGVEIIALTIKPGTIIENLADGVVVDVIQGNSYMGCQLQIDYGNGLSGRHHFLKECLVEKGQLIKAGHSLGEGNAIGNSNPSVEFLLKDENRNDGAKSEFGNGSAVSMFDYLTEKDQLAFLNLYNEKIIQPYIAQGKGTNSITLWEPFLTNEILIHEKNKNKLTGEWLLTEKWGPDDKPDILAFLDVNHQYYTGSYMRAINAYHWQALLKGHWQVDYEKNQVTITDPETNQKYYGIFEIDESKELATLKFEYQTNSFPTGFSSKALNYVERQPVNMYEQANEMNVINY